MEFRKILRNALALCLLLSIILPATVKADNEEVNYFGFSYMPPGIVDFNFFAASFSGSYGAYGTVDFLAVDLVTHLINNEAKEIDFGKLSKFQTTTTFGGHFGFFVGSDEFSVGLGMPWGFAEMGRGSDKHIAISHVGVEIPIKIAVIEELPVLLLPYWEVFSDQEGIDGKRLGLDMIANLQALEPLSFHLVWGFHHNNLIFKNIDKKENGIACQWSVGIGFDFW